MKCICGYEKERNFDNVTYTEQVEPGIVREHRFWELYYCPKCGTVKVIIDKETENEITD